MDHFLTFLYWKTNQDMDHRGHKETEEVEDEDDTEDWMHQKYEQDLVTEHFLVPTSKTSLMTFVYILAFVEFN